MGTSGFGHALRFGVGEESTYGTAVAVTDFFDVVSENFQASHNPVESGGVDTIGVKSANVAAGSVGFTGDAVIEARYTGMEKLFKHAMGGYAYTAGTGTHAFTIAAALPTGLTIEAYRDTSAFLTPDANKSLLYAGGKINSLTLDASLDAFLRLTCGFVAQTETRTAKTVTQTVGTGNLIVFTQGVLTYESAPVANNVIKVANFTLSLNNNLDTNKRRLGSRYILEPVRSGKISVSGSFSCDFISYTHYNDFLAATSKQITLVFTGGVVGAFTEKMTITVPLGKVTSNPVSTNSPGQYIQEVSFKGYRDGSNNEFSISLVNNAASVA